MHLLIRRQWILSCLCLFALLSGLAPADVRASGRERIRLDTGWRFALGHATDHAKDFGHATGYFSYLAKAGFGDGAAAPVFDDRAWRVVNIPHDWAAELPFSPKGSHSHGYKAIGRNFPENSVGWYRRTFTVPASDLGRRIRVEFDGIYRNARVFVNGFFLGEEPSGYLTISHDVSDYLNYGGENVIAVRVDASMEEGWYYEGAGIYRHAWLTKTDPVHVVRDSVWVRTEMQGDHAIVMVDAEIVNEGRETAGPTLHLEVVDAAGGVVANSDGPRLTLGAGQKMRVQQKLSVTGPKPWSIESPTLYTLRTSLKKADRTLDSLDTRFGIRTIHFDPDKGFFLNGKHVVLKGTNNHQDHAGVGVAVPDALQEFRIRRLMEMGNNAYRASHHPPTPELLDVCDRLGVLVIDETRLMGINEYHLSQLERMIRRDRNHPSIILWSLGNEEWAIEGNIKGARITTTMQDFAKRLDPTRRTTVAISGGWGGISTVVDVMGVNYIRHGSTDEQHAKYPWQIIVGTEETTTQATRGIYVDDPSRAHQAPVEDGSSGGNCEVGWKHYAARPYAAGIFYWTGFDYRGEPTPFPYPAIASQFGILDTCGFPKDSFYYLKSWWTHEPVLHVFPHWTWPGREGQSIEVRAHSNCEEVELLLNGQSLGRKRMEPNGHLAWQVIYAPGVLEARGFKAGQQILTARHETTGPAAAVKLAGRDRIAADGRDLTVVEVSLQDSAGRFAPTANEKIHFELRGPGRILGVGNGDPSSHEPDQFVPSSTALVLGTWKAPDPAVKTGKVVFEAEFDAPDLQSGQSAHLLLNALGTAQTVELNGRPLYRQASPAEARRELALGAVALQPTGNKLRIEATVYEEWRDREGLAQLQPAAIKIVTAPAPWTRSTFNGLAQVIVQSTGAPGEITLVASSGTLEPAQLKVRAE